MKNIYNPGFKFDLTFCCNTKQHFLNDIDWNIDTGQNVCKTELQSLSICSLTQVLFQSRGQLLENCGKNSIDIGGGGVNEFIFL